jgi:hypothetical protein
MLDMALAAVLDRKRNPFWRHAEGREWLCWRGAEAVGRIGACADRDLEKVVPGCGVVGFFDCIDDPEAAGRLFGEAEAWLRERGLDRARGPLNYSIHDTGGVLVDGFETPPVVDTTWNPPYYGPLWEGRGWIGAQDTLGAAGPLAGGAPERARKFAARVARRGVVVRPLDLSRFHEEAELFRKVYNAAWGDNWGHVPIGPEEFRYKAKDMKAVLEPGLLRLAEVDGEPIGLMLGLPDLNPVIRRSRGRLFPLGWLRLLLVRRIVRRVRVILLGVTPGYRKRGIEAYLLSECFKAIEGRYDWCEASWVLADNATMLNGLALYRLTPYKRWRLYERELTAR